MIFYSAWIPNYVDSLFSFHTLSVIEIELRLPKGPACMQKGYFGLAIAKLVNKRNVRGILSFFCQYHTTLLFSPYCLVFSRQQILHREISTQWG